jgi:membrane protein DedA with SNARE-associated domain
MLEKMNLLLLCEKYGYLFVLIGAIFEGDMMTVTAAYSAYFGRFNIFFLMSFIFTVTIIADQIVFLLGRKYQYKIQNFIHNPEKQNHFFVRKIRSVSIYFDKYGDFIGIIFRFLPSVRLIIPFCLGMSSMSTIKFLYLNLCSAVLWVSIMCTGGYIFAYYCSYDAALRFFQYFPILGFSLFIIVLARSWFL